MVALDQEKALNVVKFLMISRKRDSWIELRLVAGQIKTKKLLIKGLYSSTKLQAQCSNNTNQKVVKYMRLMDKGKQLDG